MRIGRRILERFINLDACGREPRVPPWTTDKTYGTPSIRRGSKDTGRPGPPKIRPSDPQTHRPRAQGRRTIRCRSRTENGANRHEGLPLDVSKERYQRRRAQGSVCQGEQAHRLRRQRGRRRRNEAIQTIIGLGAGLARVLASRRDIIAGAMFDSQHPDRRPQKQGEAGE